MKKPRLIALLGALLALLLVELAGHQFAAALHFRSRRFTNTQDRDLGVACSPDSTAKPGAPIDLLAVGDAYTDGTPGLGPKEMYPQLAAESLHKNVVNLGCGEYGTVQEELVADEWLRRETPKWLVLEVYPGNDWLDNYDYSQWRRARANIPYELYRGLVKDGMDGAGALDRLHSRLVGRSFLYTVAFDGWRKRHPREDWRRAEPGAARIGEDQAFAAVGRLQSLCARKHVKFVVLLVRIKSALDEASSNYVPVREFLAKNRIAFVDPYAEFALAENKGQELFLPSGHWNAAGQKIAADLIARKLRE